MSSANFITALNQFFIRLLVHFKLVKKSPAKLAEINQLATEQLPATFNISIPGGDGELTVLDVTLNVIAQRHCLQAELLCNFSAQVKQSLIYNTHLQLILEAKPVYCEKTKHISLSQVKINSLELLSDQYSLIKDTSSLAGGIIPRSIVSLIGVTLSTTRSLLDSKTLDNAAKYLALYASGSKQRIIDYHRNKIEQKVIDVIESGQLKYRLNESIFEEKLFARYGKKVTIDNGQMFFVFE